MVKEKPEPPEVPPKVKVVFGGLAGSMATAVAHPFDLIKVRLQLCKEFGSWGMTKEIYNYQGVRGLYAGLSAGLLRQATYTTTRLGVYTWLYDSYKKHNEKNPPITSKILLGVYAGVAGAFVGTPSEVILVRMMADGPHYPCYCRRQYRGLIHAITTIIQKEGFMAMWRGGVPTLSRSVLVSTAQLGSYTEAKEIMLSYGMKDDFYLHFYTSLISSLCTAVMSLPADNVKTRSQFAGETQGQTAILIDIIRNEGLVALWRGFPPYYFRLALHTVLTFVVLEQMNALYLEHVA